jgi:hypothetical protein
MPQVRSWWRLKKVRHRDAVILSIASSSCLLAGELASQTGIPYLYNQYLAGVRDQPLLFTVNSVLVVLAYTTYFGGIFVLLGGLHFSWGRVDRGRFLMSLGVGLSFLGLMKQFALAILNTGTPLTFFLGFSGLIGIGLLLGFVSHVLMGEYALMLKKHAKSAWRQWRRSRRPRPGRRRARNSANGR